MVASTTLLRKARMAARRKRNVNANLVLRNHQLQVRVVNEKAQKRRNESHRLSNRVNLFLQLPRSSPLPRSLLRSKSNLSRRTKNIGQDHQVHLDRHPHPRLPPYPDDRNRSRCSSTQPPVQQIRSENPCPVSSTVGLNLGYRRYPYPSRYLPRCPTPCRLLYLRPRSNPSTPNQVIARWDEGLLGSHITPIH